MYTYRDGSKHLVPPVRYRPTAAELYHEAYVNTQQAYLDFLGNCAKTLEPLSASLHTLKTLGIATPYITPIEEEISTFTHIEAREGFQKRLAISPSNLHQQSIASRDKKLIRYYDEELFNHYSESFTRLLDNCHELQLALATPYKKAPPEAEAAIAITQAVLSPLAETLSQQLSTLGMALEKADDLRLHAHNAKGVSVR